MYQLVEAPLLLAASKPKPLGPGTGSLLEDPDDKDDESTDVSVPPMDWLVKIPGPRSIVCVPVVCVCGSAVCEAVDNTWMVVFLAVLSTWSVSITKGLVASRVGPVRDDAPVLPPSLEMGLIGRQMQRDPRFVP